MSDRTPNQQRLDKLQQQLDERGATLRHVSWAPGAENLDVEARRGELANFLEAWAQGKTKELFFLRHEILTGDELLERVRTLERVLNDIGELSRAGTDTLKKIGQMADAAAQGCNLRSPDAEAMDWLEEAYSAGARNAKAWGEFMTRVAEVGFRKAIAEARAAQGAAS